MPDNSGVTVELNQIGHRSGVDTFWFSYEIIDDISQDVLMSGEVEVATVLDYILMAQTAARLARLRYDEKRTK